MVETTDRLTQGGECLRKFDNACSSETICTNDSGRGIDPPNDHVHWLVNSVRASLQFFDGQGGPQQPCCDHYVHQCAELSVSGLAALAPNTSNEIRDSALPST